MNYKATANNMMAFYDHLLELPSDLGALVIHNGHAACASFFSKDAEIKSLRILDSHFHATVPTVHIRIWEVMPARDNPEHEVVYHKICEGIVVQEPDGTINLPVTIKTKETWQGQMPSLYVIWAQELKENLQEKAN